MDDRLERSVVEDEIGGGVGEFPSTSSTPARLLLRTHAAVLEATHRRLTDPLAEHAAAEIVAEVPERLPANRHESGLHGSVPKEKRKLSYRNVRTVSA